MGDHSCIGANEGVVGSSDCGTNSSGLLDRSGTEDHPVIGEKLKGGNLKEGRKRGGKRCGY